MGQATTIDDGRGRTTGWKKRIKQGLAIDWHFHDLHFSCNIRAHRKLFNQILCTWSLFILIRKKKQRSEKKILCMIRMDPMIPLPSSKTNNARSRQQGAEGFEREALASISSCKHPYIIHIQKDHGRDSFAQTSCRRSSRMNRCRLTHYIDRIQGFLVPFIYNNDHSIMIPYE